MTIAFLQHMNIGFLQRLNPGFAESAHLHVFLPGDGDDQDHTGLLLAGLEWSQPASRWQGPVAGNLLPGPGTCALQWRGAHVRIPTATLRDVDQSLDELESIDGLESADAWHASLLAQMCLAVERQRQMAGHAAGESDDDEHYGVSIRPRPQECSN